MGIGMVAVLLHGCYSSEPAKEEETDPNTSKVQDLTFIPSAEVTVKECQAEVLPLAAQGGEGHISFSVGGEDAEVFEIDPVNNKIVFKALNLPDYETKESYSITVTARDEKDQTVTREIIVGIVQQNIIHKGIAYGCVPSPYTGKVWLDRNLGAERVCQSFHDEKCYGDYYQWGRSADGHEKMDSTTTSEQASDVKDVGHGMFILADRDQNYDWAYEVDPDGSRRVHNWSMSDGSGICPAGYRVATHDEFEAELFDENSAEIQKGYSEKATNNDDRRLNAWNSFLRLPAAGGRGATGFSPYDPGGTGVLWTGSATETKALDVYFHEYSADMRTLGGRADGKPVRCLKD